LTPDFLLDITAENGQLFVQATGQPRFPLHASARDEFFLDIVDAQLTFVRASDGKVKEVICIRTETTCTDGGNDAM
jgi:hypothetical protein